MMTDSDSHTDTGLKDWKILWGAKVKSRNDMDDNILKDIIETTSRELLKYDKIFEIDGLKCVETIKSELDIRWSPYWHVIIGKSFGSHVIHENRTFVFFYVGDKAIMVFKT